VNQTRKTLETDESEARDLESENLKFVEFAVQFVREIRKIRLQISPVQAPIEPFAAPIIGAALDRSGWTATADSYQDVNVPSNVLDGSTATIWHTEWTPVEAPLPHTITIDMNAINVLDGITYLPRQDGNSNGNIGEHQIYISVDGQEFTLVAYGTCVARSEFQGVKAA
jgi:hypothetical protein